MTVRAEARVQESLVSEEGIVETGVEAGLAEDRLSVQTQYSLHSGSLVRSIGQESSDADSVSMQVGRQSIEHSLNLESPEWFGAPLRLGFDRKHDIVLTLDGEQRSEQSGAHLNWNPEPVSLELTWRPARQMSVAGQPIDCPMNGRLSVPTTAMPLGVASSLDLLQRHCFIQAPERGLEAMPMQRHGIAWRWGDNLGQTVRVQRVVPEWQGYGMPSAVSGYEVALTQSHSFLGWQVEADVALRQADGLPPEAGPVDASRWALDLMLGREFNLIALTARWIQSKDPLWFVPMAAPIGRERVALLADFSKWLRQVMPGLDANMSASWEHSEDARGADENRVRWDFRLSW